MSELSPIRDPEPVTRVAAAPTALDYAPRPLRGRAWRRALRWWPAWLLLTAVVGLGIVYGPGAWRHWKLMRTQEVCMSAQMPQDRPVYEQDVAASSALAAAWPGEYRLNYNGWAERIEPKWVALAAEIGASGGSMGMAGFPQPRAFCHERFTPGGRRRLVAVEGVWWALVVEPAGWTGGRPRVLWQGKPEYDAATIAAIRATDGLPTDFRIFGGRPDPADPSRFTVPFNWGAIPATYEYRLGDDDRVTVRLLDPDAFIARAMALRAAQDLARTRPSRP